jgi:hypothetical protein
MIYVASPYSDPDKAVQLGRYLETLHVVAQLMAQRLPVFSPIVHCHEVALRYDLPGDAAYWQEYNTSFLRKAVAIYIILLPGWDVSKGVAQEAALAEHLNIPIHFVNVDGTIQSPLKGPFSQCVS